MNARILSSFFLLTFQCALGQVRIDTPLRFTGEDGSRQVEGLGAPTTGRALITLEDAVRAPWQWGNATVAGLTILLTLDPPVTSYVDGLLVRFLAPSDLQGALLLNVNGLGALPVLRPDGLPPVSGQLRQGTVCEAMLAGGRFVLMSAPERGCPPGTLAVNDRYCVDRSSVNAQLYVNALVVCAARGGKLCTWDEYHAACAILGTQLLSMFNEWEWIDDTSNHTQTVDQAGRASCLSQRSAGAPITTVGDTRCCFHPR